MASASSAGPSAIVSFARFPQLPTEIRLRIWAYAAPHRPRVIQVYYDIEKASWLAWKDGCGGLPPTVHVSREARSEALKSYAKVFDTYFDLEADTVFISDPMFTIRKPRKIFMDSEFAKRFKNVSFSSDVYVGLVQANDQFPDLCMHPASVLRQLTAVTNFNIVLSDDADVFYDSDDGEDSDDGDIDISGWESDGPPDHNHPRVKQAGLSSGEDQDDPGNVEYDEDGQIAVSLGDTIHDNPETEAGQSSIDSVKLDHLEGIAMEQMSKGFFRHVGNIRFESAMQNPDHWESWAEFRDVLMLDFQREKYSFPTWVRPMFGVMAVKYGLKRPGDFSTVIHSWGDLGLVEGLVEEDQLIYESSSSGDSELFSD